VDTAVGSSVRPPVEARKTTGLPWWSRRPIPEPVKPIARSACKPDWLTRESED